jgi:hypothetical protein
MRNGALCLSALLGLTVPVRGATADDGNPYRSVITGRNVFALKLPPPPPDPESLKPPPSKVTLIGIVNAFGTKKAVLKSAAAKPATPGQPPAQDEPIVLRETDSLQGITVLAIDETLGTVKIDNNGQVETLDFEKNGVKAPSGPATAPAGVAPGGVPGGLPRPGMLPGGQPLPMRPGMPMPLNPGATASPLGAAAPVGDTSLAAGGGALPQRDVRVAPERSVEENVLLYEANRIKNDALRQGGVRLPPMPPHPFLKQAGIDPNAPMPGL